MFFILISVCRVSLCVPPTQPTCLNSECVSCQQRGGFGFFSQGHSGGFYSDPRQHWRNRCVAGFGATVPCPLVSNDNDNVVNYLFKMPRIKKRSLPYFPSSFRFCLWSSIHLFKKFLSPGIPLWGKKPREHFPWCPFIGPPQNVFSYSAFIF